MTTSPLPRCPGRCGRSMPRGRPACTRCLARLPDELRADLSALTTHGGRQLAVAEARDWLLEHPAPHDPDAGIAGECEHCHAALIWLTTAAGRRMPVDADPDPEKGNVVRTGGQAGVLGPKQAAAARAAGTRLWVHHVVTCKHPERWHDKPAPKRKAARR